MSNKVGSLRKGTIRALKNVFEQLLVTLEETPSKSVTVRELTESFQREEKMIAELCDDMESRLRKQQETHFSAFTKAVDISTDKIITLCIQSNKLSNKELEKIISEQKEIEIACLQKLDKQNNEFVKIWREELGLKSQTIITKFHDEALRIMTQGAIADDAMNNLDPDILPKQ